MNKALQVLFDRGFVKDCTDLDQLSDLMDQGPVTFYLGVDPSGASMHIGHTVPVYAMRHLQEYGNNPIALVGGGTGLIGDPSGKTEMRKLLTLEQVQANAEALKNQYILQAYLMQEKGEELQNGNYAPSSSQVETFYKRNATAFTQAENVKFFQIYMAKTDNADENAKKLSTMQDVAEKIHKGSLTFEAAVNQYTEDEESKANGGEMGWLSSDNTTVRQLWGDDFVDTVLALPLGQVSDVIESNTGYHIVRVTVHNDARLLGINDRIQPDVDYTVRDYISEILANQNMQVATNNALNEMVDALRSEARVRILYK